MKELLYPVLFVLLTPLAALANDEPRTVPPGTPVTITVTAPSPPSPPVSITLGDRHGHVTPGNEGCVHTGGGNIDIQQPSSDTVVITMSGVAVAYGTPCNGSVASLDFELDQCLEVVFEKPDLKAAKVTVEARVIGLLRAEKKGTADESKGCAAILSEGGGVPVVSLCAPAHSVACGESLSINDHCGPVSNTVAAGKYKLHQTFRISAVAPRCVLPCKAPSAEFAPDPALDPLWISYKEPFHAAIKKDFGLQVIIKVAADTNPPPPPEEKKEGNAKEKLPEPQPGEEAPRRSTENLRQN
jgi:hypothetical protein